MTFDVVLSRSSRDSLNCQEAVPLRSESEWVGCRIASWVSGVGIGRPTTESCRRLGARGRLEGLDMNIQMRGVRTTSLLLCSAGVGEGNVGGRVAIKKGLVDWIAGLGRWDQEA